MRIPEKVEIVQALRGVAALLVVFCLRILMWLTPHAPVP